MITPHTPIIPLVSRGINHCLDLAFRYLGRFLTLVLGMWLLVAIPTSALVYVCAVKGPWDLRLTLILIYFATLPLGVLVMNDAVPRIFGRALSQESARLARTRNGGLGLCLVLMALGFGWAFLSENMGDRLGLSLHAQKWSIAGGLGFAGFIAAFQALISVARYQQIDWGTARMFFLSLCLRSVCALGPVLILFPPILDWRLAPLLIVTLLPAIFIALRSGFLLEHACLTRLDPELVDDEAKQVVNEETGDLFGRAIWMAQFSLMIWGVLFLSFDAVSSLIFRTPIFLGRVMKLPSDAILQDYLQHAWNLFQTDPLVLATLTATALLVYPLNRLAWFFCYIDIRVRRDCWDLELQFSQETHVLAQSHSQNPSNPQRTNV